MSDLRLLTFRNVKKAISVKPDTLQCMLGPTFYLIMCAPPCLIILSSANEPALNQPVVGENAEGKGRLGALGQEIQS